MSRNLLLGVEAIGQGAVDAGISGVYAYPGTPSTEITEYIQNNSTAIERDIHRRWSANEKTAMESALGMSYAGKRALVCMKHVGLNVAADAFINSAVTGINGGLVLVVADDPSMHSSQNEQDSRFYGKFAMIPMLEPSNQQEAYEMTQYAFELSELTREPVLLRITTRLAHSRAGIVTRNPREENQLKMPADPRQFVLLPAIARKRYQMLLSIQNELARLSEESPYNQLYEGRDKSLGIICSGIAYNYLIENYPGNSCPYMHLKVGQYPIPAAKIKAIEKECDELLVIEEGYPLIEEQLSDFFGKGTRIRGRLDGTLPRDGELNPDLVSAALQLEKNEVAKASDKIAPRPPALCTGCGHQDLYAAMNEVLADHGDGHVFSDIGCYTLGALPPYETINSCVDMGASITMAKGAADAGLFPSLAVIGDSTFTHSGMTGLLDAVNENSNIVVIISDNDSVSMTGGQESSASGKIEAICKGIGVEAEHIRTVVPHKKNHEEMVKMIREEIAYTGVSVIVPRRECIQKVMRDKRNLRKHTKNNCR
ncbi:thiamine pyrophosphate-dependent enzyme [Roseimarinus sediminis]|uniref:thiamine pyrophosphate-dependent enzyme n=1 Tax=Roseimarinus sediminis TaxID=1610899 RepID=UPI003D20664E